MPEGISSSDEYVKKLRQRAKDSHVYRAYQLLGLQISQILGDAAHKALYIKMAKQYGDGLLGVAKDVADRGDVKNKGAYFMRVVAGRPKTAWDDIATGVKPVKNLFKKKPAVKKRKPKVK